MLALLVWTRGSSPALETGGDLLVKLDAGEFSSGAAAWANQGSLGGLFTASGTPKREVIQEGQAVVFDGHGDFFTGPLSPAALHGAAPTWTVEVWTWQGNIRDEETLVAWGRRAGPPGSNAAFGYGTNPAWGAIVHAASPEVGWEGGAPAAGSWHHLAYTSDGSTVRAYADGVLRGTATGSLDIIAGQHIRLGLQNAADGSAETWGNIAFSGGIGRVRIHSGPLTAAQILNNYQEERADYDGTAPVADVLRRTPVNRYSFDQAAGAAANGTEIIDSLGGKHGVIRGAGAISTGTRIDLPGGSSATSAYVDLPNGLISIHQAVSLEFWATLDPPAGEVFWPRLLDIGSSSIGKIFGPGGGAASGGLSLMLSAYTGDASWPDKQFDLVAGTFLNGGTHRISAGNHPGQERHYVITYDPVAREWRHYENGLLFDAIPALMGPNSIRDVNNWLGRSQFSADSNLDGKYNELRIYDYALNQAEINRSRETGPDTLPPALSLVPGFSDENWHGVGGIGTWRIEGSFRTAVADEDGNIYVGGSLTSAGGVPVNNIAKWDGRQWSALSEGVDGQVNALLIINGNLYVGGQFNSAGGVPAHNIAKWDGREWSALGSGVRRVDNHPVYVAHVSDLAATGDGDLIVGGDFHVAGDVSANSVARWNGEEWSAVGGGVYRSDGFNASVGAVLAVNDEIYVAGYFHTAGSTSVSHIARWDGSEWREMGAGLDANGIWDLAYYKGEVFVSGFIHQAGGQPVNGIAKWNGTGWSALSEFLDTAWGNAGGLLAVAGDALYATGYTLKSARGVTDVVKWDGARWSVPGGGVTVSGYPAEVEGKLRLMSAASHLTWDGAVWSTPWGGISAEVKALAIMGDTLYIGGGFRDIGGMKAEYVAGWNGREWFALEGGMNGPVNALAVVDGVLYAGGSFTSAGGRPASRVARWNGSGWAAVGSGTDSDVYALAAAGGNLYAGGVFGVAGGVAAGRVARWNGSQWSPLGGGVDGHVRALTLMNGHVYAGGHFGMAGGVAASNIAGWDGTQWFALGNGVNGGVLSLAANGVSLFAGGAFHVAGETQANNVARWSQGQWSALEGGVGSAVNALACMDEDVYVGGNFSAAGDVPARGIAKWDGGEWSPLGSGLTGQAHSLLAADGSVHAGGNFTTAGGKPFANIASAVINWTDAETLDLSAAFADTTPSAVRAGDIVKIQWRVTNESETPVRGVWNDRIYLTDRPGLTGQVTRLDGQRVSVSIGAGNSYTQSVSLPLSGVLPGNYYLVAQVADGLRATRESPILISQPLQITWDTLALGGSLTRDWNEGGWSFAKLEIPQGTPALAIEVESAPGSEVALHAAWLTYPNPQSAGTRSAALSGSHRQQLLWEDPLPGTYYLAVRRPVATTPAGSHTLRAGIPDAEVTALALGQPYNGTLRAGQAILFEVNAVPGQPLSIDLSNLPVDGSVALYLRREAWPSRSVYDRAVTTPFTPDMYLYLPDAREGRYYIMVEALGLATERTDFRLAATSPDFSILTSNFGTGGTGGNFTIQAVGNRLDPTVRARIVGVDGADRPDLGCWFGSESEVYPTFDLRGLPPGIYDIAFTNGKGESVVVPRSLTVVEAVEGPHPVVPRLAAPSAIRRDTNYSFTVEWENASLNDAVPPLVTISNTTAFGITPSDGSLGISHAFLGINTHEGPPGILRPGQREFATFWAGSGVEEGDYVVSVDHVTEDSEAAFDWPAALLPWRPAAMTEAQVSELAAELSAAYGATEAGYIKALASFANIEWEKTGNPNELLQRQVLRAWSRLSFGVWGTVSSSTDPASGYALRLEDGKNQAHSARTDRQGGFYFSGLPDGTYRLTVEQATLTTPAQGNVVVSGGHSTGPVALTVAPVRQFAVQINVGDGTPGANAVVIPSRGEVRFDAAVTDAEGMATFYGLEPGTYDLTVSDGQGEFRKAKGIVVTVNPPAVTRLNLVQAMVRGTLPPGEDWHPVLVPVADGELEFIPAKIERDQFTIQAPAGHYKLMVFDETGTPIREGGPWQITPGADIDAGLLGVTGAMSIFRTTLDNDGVRWFDDAEVKTHLGGTPNSYACSIINWLDKDTDKVKLILGPDVLLGNLVLTGTEYTGVIIQYLNGGGYRQFSDGSDTVEGTWVRKQLSGIAQDILDYNLEEKNLITSGLRNYSNPRKPDKSGTKEWLAGLASCSASYVQKGIENGAYVLEPGKSRVISIPDEPNFRNMILNDSISRQALFIQSDSVKGSDELEFGINLPGACGTYGTPPEFGGTLISDFRYVAGGQILLTRNCDGRYHATLSKVRLHIRDAFDLFPGNLGMNPFVTYATTILAFLEINNAAHDVVVDIEWTDRDPRKLDLGVANRPKCEETCGESKNKRCIQRPTSFDPNDIIGPAGVGPGNHVFGNAVMPYTIRFENHATQASAPAARVTVTQQLDADLDWTSFRLGSLGFGDTVVTVPPDAVFHATRVDLRETRGVYVDIRAGLSIATGEVHWEFVAIDPATGELPEDPRVGFLPPNANPPEGEGFVTYTIHPKRPAASGTRIDAVASIIFDVNPPIITPAIFHTLDDGPPDVAADATADGTEAASVEVVWLGDDRGGAGVASYDVSVSVDGGAFTPWLSGTWEQEGIYSGRPGQNLQFRVSARDLLGQRTPTPATVSITVPEGTAPGVRPLSPQSITARAAVLRGVVTPGIYDTEAFFEIGLAGGSWPADGALPVAEGRIAAGAPDTSVTVPVSGLAPHTAYRFRLIAENAGGLTVSPEAAFSTLNTPPAFSGYSFSVSKGRAVDVAWAKILARAADEDGDPLTLTGIPAATAQGGVLTQSAHTLRYTAPAGFTGPDSFPVTISDGFGGETAGSVIVDVTEEAGPSLNFAGLSLKPDGGVSLHYYGIPGRSYTLQRSLDLLTWEDVQTLDAASNGLLDFSDPAPPAGDSAFYRTREDVP